MEILPSRPLQLDPAHLRELTRGSWIFTALCFAVGVAFLCFTFDTTREVLAEREIWIGGVPGEVHDVSGSVRESEKFGIAFYYDYDLDVAYADQAGAAHRGNAEFSLLWTPADETADVALRYDPANPARFALSSSAEAGLARWGWPLVGTALSLLMASGVIGARRSHARTLRSYELAAVDGAEIFAPIVSVVRPRLAYEVTFSWPDTGEKIKEILNGAPLVVERSEIPHVVVLRSPRGPGAHVVLQADLAPFRFDSDVKAAILQRAKRRVEGSLAPLGGWRIPKVSTTVPRAPEEIG